MIHEGTLTERERIAQFWRDLETTRYRRHPQLSYRQWLTRPELEVIAEVREIIARHQLPYPEEIETEILKLRRLYRQQPAPETHP